MPIITVEAGSVTKEVKENLMKSLTETASKVSGVPQTSFTVLIKENPVENWGIGGEPLEKILRKNTH